MEQEKLEQLRLKQFNPQKGSTRTHSTSAFRWCIFRRVLGAHVVVSFGNIDRTTSWSSQNNHRFKTYGLMLSSHWRANSSEEPWNPEREKERPQVALLLFSIEFFVFGGPMSRPRKRPAILSGNDVFNVALEVIKNSVPQNSIQLEIVVSPREREALIIGLGGRGRARHGMIHPKQPAL